MTGEAALRNPAPGPARQASLDFRLGEQGRVAASCRGVNTYMALDDITHGRPRRFRNQRQDRPRTPGQCKAYRGEDFPVSAAGDSVDDRQHGERIRSDLAVEDNGLRIPVIIGERCLNAIGNDDGGISGFAGRCELPARHIRARTEAKHHSTRCIGKPVRFAGRPR